MINVLRIPSPPGPLFLTSHKDSSLRNLIVSFCWKKSMLWF